MIALQEAGNSNSQQIFKTTQSSSISLLRLHLCICVLCIMFIIFNFFFQVAQLKTSSEEVKSINLFLLTAVYKILDSVTKMLSTLKWKTLESRRTIVCLPTCMR